MKLELNATEQALQTLLQAEPVAALLSSLGLKNPLLGLSDTGISLKLTKGRFRYKIKLGLAASGGLLSLNLRDVRIEGISVGTSWADLFPAFHLILPGGIEAKLAQGILWLSSDRIKFLATGTSGDQLTIIAEAA